MLKIVKNKIKLKKFYYNSKNIVFIMTHTELYDTLEVSPNATMDEIKKAYRKLAIKFHPDRNADKKEECTEKTQKLNFAYEILSNPEKRENYDRNGLNEETPDLRGFNPFEQLFRQQQPKNEKKDEIVLKINLKKIFFGKEKTIKITQKCKCTKCETSIKKCNECNGNGFRIMMRQMGPMLQQIQMPCDKCDQKGKIIKSQNCSECVMGLISKNIEYKLVIQKNQDYQNVIKLEGYGNYNFETNKQNDLYIKFEIKDEIYETENYNILHTFNIYLNQAFTGEDIYIMHPNGKIYKLTTENIIKDGDVKMIKNLGIPNLYGSGNFIIKFKYVYPSKLLTIDNYTTFLMNENEKHENYTSEYLIDMNEQDNEEDLDRQAHGMQAPQCTQS
jgi:DnaJ family protein A protein 2